MKRFIYISADRGIPIPGNKGGSHHVVNVCRTLHDQGWTGRIYTASPVSEVPGLHLAPLDALPRSPGDVDFVYERYSLWHLDGLRSARRAGVPFILEVNSPLPNEALRYRSLDDAPRAREVAGVLMREADRVIAVSDGVARWVAGLRGSDDGVCVVPNGVDEFVFDLGVAPVAVPFQVSTGPIIGFSGSFRPWHDLNGLLEAVAHSRYRPRVLCIGDGPARSDFEARAESLGLTGRIHVTGFVPQDSVPKWLAACDLAVAPYGPSDLSYFSPLKVFEFMAMGLPVIGANIEQLGDLLDTRALGMTYTAGDAGELMAAMDRILADPVAARIRALLARRWVLRHATWSCRVSAILESIASIRVAHG